jgi:hypothetical protein
MEAVTDEHGKWFHQDISQIAKRYNGKWSPRMWTNYCWQIEKANQDTVIV